LFILFSFGDVSDHDDGLVVGEGDDSGFSPSFLVMEVEGIFEGLHFLGGDSLFDGGEELIGQVGREDVGEVFTDDILFAPDGFESFGAMDLFVDTVSADAEDHIGDGLEEELVGALGLVEVLFRPFALGDVMEDRLRTAEFPFHHYRHDVDCYEDSVAVLGFQGGLVG